MQYYTVLYNVYSMYCIQCSMLLYYTVLYYTILGSSAQIPDLWKNGQKVPYLCAYARVCVCVEQRN